MELEPRNDTPYEVSVLPFLSAGSTFHTVIVKATFSMAPEATAEKAPEQIPLTGADIIGGEGPGAAARYESDFVPFKPKADVLCVGKAHAPKGETATELLVRLCIGPVDKVIRVIGNRRWEQTFSGLRFRISEPEPFESIDVCYENAYGGMDPDDPEGYASSELNPIGKGYTKKGKQLAGMPLPNLEDPTKPIRHWDDRMRPQSFGPVGRTWVPRIKRAGTYDANWLAQRSPELPEDFDDAFYNGAPADQQIQGYLRGNEEIQIDNMHPAFRRFRCKLPGVRVRSLVNLTMDSKERLYEIPLNLDTLWVDMDALLMVLVWRGRLLDMPLTSDTNLLIVEEPLNTVPSQPESYRSRLLAFEDAEKDAEREFDEAQEEVAAMESGSADSEVMNASEPVSKEKTQDGSMV
jgi:hypothetical protein